MQKIKPTESELEILSLLWENGPCTVKKVNDKLNQKKEVGYTTTLKLMQIMFEKKFLSRIKSGRSHIYEAVIKKNDTQGVLLEKVLKTAFAGSASKLVMQVIRREGTTKEEIGEIKKYLDSLEENKNGTK